MLNSKRQRQHLGAMSSGTHSDESTEPMTAFSCPGTGRALVKETLSSIKWCRGAVMARFGVVWWWWGGWCGVARVVVAGVGCGVIMASSRPLRGFHFVSMVASPFAEDTHTRWNE